MVILVITYKRFDYLDQTLNSLFKHITSNNISKIYISQDGMNENDDVVQYNEITNIVNSIPIKYDYNGEIIIKNHNINLGCKNHILSALNWISNLEEQILILEDDILLKNNISYLTNNFFNKIHNNKLGIMRLNHYYWGWATNSYTIKYFLNYDFTNHINKYVGCNNDQKTLLRLYKDEYRFGFESLHIYMVYMELMSKCSYIPWDDLFLFITRLNRNNDMIEENYMNLTEHIGSISSRNNIVEGSLNMDKLFYIENGKVVYC